METKTLLFAACVSPLEDDALYRAAYCSASPKRREKTDRLRQKSDRLLSLGAELLLKYALSRFGIREYKIEYGGNGKPYLAGNGAFFNLSHSGEYVLCAVSENEVGCDIEKLDDADLRIAQLFFTSGEYAEICAQTTKSAQDEMFFRCWTLKESLMKFTGTGMALSPDSFAISFGKQISASGFEGCYFKGFDTIAGYRCALCSGGECSGVGLELIDIRDILKAEVME